jgi:ATP-binding protein involved in chromosome partitioning
MLGIEGGLQADGQRGMHPIEAHGVHAVSIGFVLPPGTPVVWRGPMIGSGVRQLMHDVDWGELDYLIIDLPPGTSDASMSMCQDALIAGVVIVSTPQKVAIEDARKAIGMFDRLGVPIFGIVENMSSDVFGRGGASDAADELGVEFLGELPLDVAIREGGDTGAPVVAAHPESPIAGAFIELAEQVAARCSVLQFAGEAGAVA